LATKGPEEWSSTGRKALNKIRLIGHPHIFSPARLTRVKPPLPGFGAILKRRSGNSQARRAAYEKHVKNMRKDWD
jgi:hypothetical protein